MATWWKEREALVTEAIAMVSAQKHCTHADAIALLRRRAEAMDADLEAAAAAVVALGTRLGYRDLGPSYTTNPADEPAETGPVSVT
jgi:hypothetical protein